MNVNELMSREPRVVRTADRLDAAARVLWEQDCGIVPVVDASNVVVGVLTDRDLCMATYTQGRPLDGLPVAAVMARTVRTCRPDDSLATAMATMQQQQVRRLPVVDARGVLVGVLSTNDLVRAAQTRPAALDAGSVVKLLAAIGAPRRVAANTGTTATARSTTGNVAEAAATTSGTARPAAAPKPMVANGSQPAANKAKPKPKPKGRKA